jgi:hypothetical protein
MNNVKGGNEQDLGKQQQQRSTNQKAGSNEYDVEMEKMRLEASKESKSTNEHDEKIAQWKLAEVKAMAELDHTLAMTREKFKNEQQIRDTYASIAKWFLVCATIAATQITNTLSHSKVAATEAQFGTPARKY